MNFPFCCLQILSALYSAFSFIDMHHTGGCLFFTGRQVPGYTACPNLIIYMIVVKWIWNFKMTDFLENVLYNKLNEAQENGIFVFWFSHSGLHGNP